MKLKEIYDGYNGFANVGHYCAFIVFDESGVDMSPKALAEKMIPYSYAVLTGSIFADKIDLKDFVAKVIKQNKYFFFEMHVDGSNKPLIGMFPGNNIDFIFPLNLNSEYNDANITWFKTWKAKFLLPVHHSIEINFILSFAQKLEIPKSQIWLDITNSDELDDIMRRARIHGLNVAPRLREWLWEKIGGNDGDSSK